MHQEIRLHGHLDDTIEYFAVMAAGDACNRYFFETTGDGLRFFSPGNEVVLGRELLGHRGNGGSFCEYMFGVDQPLADLAKPEVRNRLILYGAFYRDETHLEFTGQTEGQSSYERIFFEGNSLYNYFFFLTGSVDGSLREQQENIARLLGKTLKRSRRVGLADDTELLEELVALLGHRSSFYLIKLIHKRHRAYYEAFRTLYFSSKSIADEDFQHLQSLADDLRIDRYQQERIRIDVMYRHPDNRRIVDEYKNILIDCNRRGSVNQLENARLTRLKTLSVRNKIPSALFYALDEMLMRDQLIDLGEQDYLAETRQVLEGIFLTEAQIDAGITAEDLKLLLHAKRQAREHHDHTFEQILLDTGRACDERLHEGGDLALLEQFSYVVTYFDRFDTTYATLNELVFMDNARCSEEKIRSLLGNKKAFDALDPSLWNELFFGPVFDNKYLGRFGRRKADSLAGGLQAIEEGRLAVPDLVGRLRDVEAQGRFYATLLGHVKERIRNFYSRYNSRAEQETLFAEVAEELRHKGLLAGDLSPGLFREVVVNIRKEAVYLHNLLPKIVAERNVALREDFLDNSGLDRFYVEELEREYFELNNLDLEDLYLIRKGFAA